MADFRKWLIAFAAIALVLSLSSSANAAAFTCVANAGNPTVVRAEGITELVGDILIQCTGGAATAAGAAIPPSNITLSLNTNITSRLLGNGYIDSLLLLDEASPGAPNPPNATVPSNPAGTNDVNGNFVPFGNITQSAPCYSNTFGSLSSPTNCNQVNGTGGLSDPYVNVNLFVARQAAANSVTWLGIPIDAPGTAGTRTIRLTNIRANACQLGVSSSLVPTQITAFIGINGSQNLTLSSPQVTVAFISTGLVVTAPVTTPISNLQQCVNFNTGFFGSSATGPATFIVRVTEGFAASFKRRVAQVGTLASPNGPTIPLGGNNSIGLQNVPGFPYNTESGFVISTSPSGIGTAPFGLADTATRILVRFNNVGAGTRLLAATVVPLTVGDSTSPGNPQPPSSLTGFTGGFLQLVGGFVDQFGNAGTNVSGFATGTATFNGGLSLGAAPFNGAAEIPVTNGTAQAVYEVVNADPFAVERANIGIGVSFTSNTSQNLPAPGTTTLNVSFAPIGPVTTAYNSADSALPIPRFCDQSTARNVFSILACTCNILFPFVTNQAGFDTGVAIANTSQDPFGTAPQSGTVVLNYYGSTTGGGAAPPAQTSTVVPAGTELVFTLAGGGTNGITATPGFQGYIIANAKFQFCHGFAFISDLGAQKLAEGYLGIILDNPGLNRTGITGENEGH
jgi:hypothetical protein